MGKFNNNKDVVYSYSSDGELKKYNPDKKYDGIIRIRLEKRNGKPVTVIFGFNEKAETIKSIAADLKKQSGSGGTHKEDLIEIQGDKRDTAEKYLTGKGYKVKRAGG